MAREKENFGEKKSNGSFVEVEDIDGNKVRMSLDKAKGDFSIPQKDADGLIPEFVNISGVRQQMVLPNDPNGTIKIEPFGILRGAQWRSFSDPAPAWGHTPKFMERKRKADGEFDPVYLLDVSQVTTEIERIKNPDPGFHAYRLLELWEANGKVHEIDKAGRILQKEYSEDRGPVLTAIAKKLSQLKKLWEIEKKNRGISGTLD